MFDGEAAEPKKSAPGPEPEPEPGGRDSGDSALRAELAGLTERKLERRAAKEGVPDDKIDQAEDAADPKALLIQLILEATTARGGAALQRPAVPNQRWEGDPNIRQRLAGGSGRTTRTRSLAGGRPTWQSK